jgi:mannose-6-phosphate isomerase-like protein (cupin superfamily)
MRNLAEVGSGFAVLENGSQLQTAVMLLEPGEASGPLANEHLQSEQVLVVVEGTVEAEIGNNRFTMKSGDSAIVPRDEPHRFTNRSSERAVTFNVYAPKAY